MFYIFAGSTSSEGIIIPKFMNFQVFAVCLFKPQ